MNSELPVRYVVSACLAGFCCRYDGKSNMRPEIARLVSEGRAVPVCPEVLGGLSVPRPPCELVNGRVLTKNGEDRTEAFCLGAEKAYAKAAAFSAKIAILKARSPSCGLGLIYDGRFCRTLISGNGVFAALLKSKGFEIFTEEDFPLLSWG